MSYSGDEEVFFDNPDESLEEEKEGLNWFVKLVIILVILGLLTTLAWPLLHFKPHRVMPSTPTPLFLLEA